MTTAANATMPSPAGLQPPAPARQPPELVQQAYTETHATWATVATYLSSGYTLLAFDILSKTTDAITTNCERLGLAYDDAPYTALSRDTFWRDLNSAWLNSLHHCFAKPPIAPEQQLNEHHLLHLRTQIVSWADALERYGLVDYEMGFAERDILDQVDAALRYLGYEVVEMEVGDHVNMNVNGDGEGSGDIVFDGTGAAVEEEDGFADPEYMARLLGYDPGADASEQGGEEQDGDREAKRPRIEQ